ncbi:ORF6N domain-containing protein [Halobacteriovorax sp. HLS]
MNSEAHTDSDLAELYGVETKTLKKTVRRNIGRRSFTGLL